MIKQGSTKGVLLILLAAGISGCNNVKFAEQPLSSVEEIADGPAEPVDPDVVKATCANNRLVTSKHTITFPKPAKACEFNADGNLERVDRYFQARIEQAVSFTLPADSVLCGMDFQFSRQSFRYDDYFAMTFNNVVIASAFNFGPYLEQSNGLQLWDWNRVSGRPWSLSTEATYCAGQEQGMSTCSWPETQTVGDINLNLDPDILERVTARDINRNQHEFKFITTGDNDLNIDCLHEPISFDVTVKYVPQP